MRDRRGAMPLCDAIGVPSASGFGGHNRRPIHLKRKNVREQPSFTLPPHPIQLSFPLSPFLPTRGGVYYGRLVLLSPSCHSPVFYVHFTDPRAISFASFPFTSPELDQACKRLDVPRSDRGRPCKSCVGPLNQREGANWCATLFGEARSSWSNSAQSSRVASIERQDSFGLAYTPRV